MANKHISYRQFKNIFGDLGVTAWVKFNWLSNGIPDGTYNGITKVTINGDSVRPTLLTTVWNLNVSNPFIPVESNSDVWAYGLSNYEIYSRTELSEHNGIAFHATSTNTVLFNKVGLTTAEEVKEYLNKYPIILYYYDRNEWGGNILTKFNAGTYVLFNDNLMSIIQPNTEIKDVLGKYSFSGYYSTGQSFAQTAPDFSIGLNTTSAPNPNRMYLKDSNYGLDDTKFNNNECPRAIVYKLAVPQ